MSKIALGESDFEWAERSFYAPQGGVVWSQDWDPLTKFSVQVNRHIHSEKTRYQKIDFYDSQTYGRFFTLDGLMKVNEKDEFIYHEMTVHVAMATHPSVKKVLILGGGDGGTSREVARYKTVEKITLVEADARVVKLCEHFLPVTAGHFIHDNRIELKFTETFNFIQNAEPTSYDLVIVDSACNLSSSTNYDIREFYGYCHRVLKNDGILIAPLDSPYYDFHIQRLGRTYKAIKNLFPIMKAYQYHMPTYPSGHCLLGFASKKYDPLKHHQASEWELLELNTKYYNSEVHQAAFALPNYVKKLFDKTF